MKRQHVERRVQLERRAQLLENYLLSHGYEMRHETSEMFSRAAVYKRGSTECIPGSANWVQEYYFTERLDRPLTTKSMREHWGPLCVRMLTAP
jgi:hypothetical protein